MQFCSHALRGKFTWRAAPLMDAARPDSVPTQRVGTRLHRNDGFSNVFMSCPLVCLYESGIWNVGRISR